MSITPELISELRSLLPEVHIVDPSSADYEKAIHRWTSISILPAGAVAYPTTPSQVSTLVSFASEHNLDLATRCGGHGARAISSTSGGLCIDLAKIRAFSLDDKTKRVTISGGALWSDIYSFLQPHNLAMVGGECSDVGIGGYSLIGGYGWLSGAHGLALDNIIEVEVVLADGRIVRASETQNADLFWAIRGCGPAFGIITEFVMQAYPQPNLVWCGTMILHRKDLKVVVEVANSVVGEENSNGLAQMATTWCQIDDALVISAMLFYNGSETEARSFFKPLLDLNPAVNTTKMMPFAEIAYPEAPVLLKTQTAGGAVMQPFDLSFLEELWAMLEQIVNEEDTEHSVLEFQIFNATAVLRRMQTETAFSNRGRITNILIACSCGKETTIARARKWVMDVRNKVDRELEVRKRGDNVDGTTRSAVGAYANHDGFGRPGREIFGVNYDRLVYLKHQFDPRNIFNKFANLAGSGKGDFS